MPADPPSDTGGAAAGHGAGTPPSAWVTRFAPLIPTAAPVLDLACGGGRHSRLLAARGHPVLAVDRDAAALAALAPAAIETARIDLESAGPRPFVRPPLAGRRFGGIVVTNYLHRPVLGDLVAALAPDGVLIYETFAVGNEAFGRPSNPAFLLRPGELLAVVADLLTVVAYEHCQVNMPKPAVMQRICAGR